MFTISGWAASLIMLAVFQCALADIRFVTWERCRESPTWKAVFNEYTTERKYPVDYDADTLNLRFCNLTNLEPEGFAGLPSVTKLFLSHNNLQDLDLSVFKTGFVPSLKTIQLDSNNLTSPDFDDHVLSPHLEEIDLSSNQIEELNPRSFASCAKLKVLSMHSNNISHFSQWTDGPSYGLTTIEELYLSHNKITQIQCIPSGSCLRILDLAYNGLTEIPTGCGRDNSVQKLILSGNSIANINNSALFFYPRLSELKLDRNNITYIHPQAFSNNLGLTLLDLSDNKLTEAPIFNQYVTLRYGLPLISLYLSRNQITEIKNTTFTNCENLRVLELDNNNITYLHPELFSTLIYLVQLNLTNNHISDLPNTMFSNNKDLFELWLKDNMIRHLPNNMFINNKSLKHLWLQGNFIHELSAEFIFMHRDAKIPFAQISFKNNPWDCECLFEALVEEWKHWGPLYFYDHPKPVNGSVPACVAGAVCPVMKRTTEEPLRLQHWG